MLKALSDVNGEFIWQIKQYASNEDLKSACTNSKKQKISQKLYIMFNWLKFGLF